MDNEELLQYQRQFSSILVNIPLGWLMMDAEWNIVFVNDFFLEITGWSREEILQKRFVEILVPIRRRDSAVRVQTLVAGGRLEVPSYDEKEVVLKGGETVVFEWNNSPIKNAAGKFLGISSFGKPKTVPITQILADSKLFESLENRQDDQRVVGDYILLKALGGENGHVQLAIHKTTQKKVAVKTLKKDQMNEEELERARREIKIMEKLTQLDNPHIIKLIDWHETSMHFNLIVEYVSGGELVSLIKERGGLEEPFSKKLFKQMVCALRCCHQQNIIHRDLKLQNILLDSEGNIKLIDFGLSNFVETGVFRSTFCGTPAFAPPEILLGTEYKGPEVDLWSLGVVLYSMITAEFPFKTVGEILKGKYTPPEGVSEDCRDLLKRLLVVKKEDRLDVEGISKHPWLTSDDPALTGFSEAIDEPHVKRRRSC